MYVRFSTLDSLEADGNRLLKFQFIFDPDEFDTQETREYFVQKLQAILCKAKKEIPNVSMFRVVLSFSHTDENETGYSVLLSKIGCDFPKLINTTLETFVDHANAYRVRNSTIDCTDCYLIRALLFGGLVITISDVESEQLCPSQALHMAVETQRLQVSSLNTEEDNSMAMRKDWNKQFFKKY